MEDEKPKVVNVDDWVNMNLDELFEQRTLMYDRYEFLLGTKKEYSARILEGLQKLEAIIAKKVSR
jgi:hypothetical protein